MKCLVIIISIVVCVFSLGFSLDFSEVYRDIQESLASLELKEAVAFPPSVRITGFDAGKMKFNNLTVKFVTVDLGAPLSDVLSFYQRHFQKEGFNVYQLDTAGFTTLMVLDMDQMFKEIERLGSGKGVQGTPGFVVNLMPQGKRSTKVMFGRTIGDVMEVAGDGTGDSPGFDPEFLPRPPDSIRRYSSVLDKPSGKMYNFVYDHHYSSNYVKDFYKSRMEEKGWSVGDFSKFASRFEETKGLAKNPDTLMAKKGDKVCFVSTRADEEEFNLFHTSIFCVFNAGR